jgi:putative addiction module component (TIGR02574 family)
MMILLKAGNTANTFWLTPPRAFARLIEMSTRADTVLDTALALPTDERAWLASELIASLDEGEDADVEAAWAVEIERRIAEVDSGHAKTVSWEEARTRIKATLEKS